MLRFNEKPRFANDAEPPRFLSRREQRRLYTMVFALVFVIWAAFQAREPQHWTWLWGMTNTSQAAPEIQVAGGAGLNQNDQKTTPVDSDQATDSEDARSAGPEPAGPENHGYFPGVDVEYLRMIEDNKVFRHTGERAWLNLIETLQTNKQSTLDAASLGPVTYTQLKQQPAHYRGQLVTLQGTALRCLPKPAVKNKLGIETLHKIVFRAEGGANQPIFVYVLDLPSGFPVGEKIREPIYFTGFFFKDLVFTDGADLHVAPTLLAKTIRSEKYLSGANDAKSRDTKGQGGASTNSSKTNQPSGLSPANNHRPTRPTKPLTESEKKTPQTRLTRAGIDESQFNRLTDGEAPNADEQEVLLKMLYHVRRFNLEELKRWTQTDWDESQLAKDPAAYRGQLFALRGRVKSVTIETPPPEVVARYEMDKYYLCQIELNHPKQTAWVFTPRLPKTWDISGPLDERVSVDAMFMKLGPSEAGLAELVFVAPRIAWNPDGLTQEALNRGQIILGELGMDVSLWDEVRQPGRLDREDYEAFYQLFAAIGHVSASQLEKGANSNLRLLAADWKKQYDAGMKKLQAESKDQSKQNPTREKDLRRRVAMARESYQAAEQGRYPIVRLFNLPKTEIGELVTLEGVARRAVKIRVDDPLSSEASDIQRRFGLDHYWEMELFTPDSKDNPVVFCTRELPEGFPIGDEIYEPVRVVGFFFKSWAYRRGKTTTEQTGDSPAGKTSQLAPLIIGKQPTWLQTARVESDPTWGILGGGLFALLLVGVAFWVWRNSRADSRFEREVLSDRYREDDSETRERLAELAIESVASKSSEPDNSDEKSG